MQQPTYLTLLSVFFFLLKITFCLVSLVVAGMSTTTAECANKSGCKLYIPIYNFKNTLNTRKYLTTIMLTSS